MYCCFTSIHGQVLRTGQWFTIQHIKWLHTNGWFKERWCVGLISYIVHQNTRSRLTNQSMIRMVAIRHCDWWALCSAGQRWKGKPHRKRPEDRSRDKSKLNTNWTQKMARLVWLMVHLKLFDEKYMNLFVKLIPIGSK